jgi:hypothetical protein
MYNNIKYNGLAGILTVNTALLRELLNRSLSVTFNSVTRVIVFIQKMVMIEKLKNSDF